MSIWDESTEQYCPGGKKSYWETLDSVERYQNRRSTGNEDENAVSVAMKHLANLHHRPRRVLWVGCLEGDPSPDMDVMRAGLAEEIRVTDIAQGLLDKQRARAAALGLTGIDYTFTDLNVEVFPADHFDVVIGWGTIHHVENLEHFFAQVRRTLRPGGLFVLREYVGPTRIQFTPEQLAVCNRLMSTIPERRRMHAEGFLMTHAIAPPLENLMAADPSESVRSGDILPVARAMLPGLDARMTGGCILHPLLAGIAWNFEDEDGEALVQAWIAVEEELVDGGLLASDYCTAYWYKPGTSWTLIDWIRARALSRRTTSPRR